MSHDAAILFALRDAARIFNTSIANGALRAQAARIIAGA